MENKVAIREEVLHSVKLGEVEVGVDSDQLKLLSLYLAFVINEPAVDYPFFLKAITGQPILIVRNSDGIDVYRCTPAPSPVISSSLTEDDIKDLSSALVRYSRGSIHTPILYGYAAYQNKAHAEEYGGWIKKDEDNVVFTLASDFNPACALFVDDDRKIIYGVAGYTQDQDGKVIPVLI